MCNWCALSIYALFCVIFAFLRRGHISSSLSVLNFFFCKRNLFILAFYVLSLKVTFLCKVQISSGFRSLFFKFCLFLHNWYADEEDDWYRPTSMKNRKSKESKSNSPIILSWTFHLINKSWGFLFFLSYSFWRGRSGEGAFSLFAFLIWVILGKFVLNLPTNREEQL